MAATIIINEWNGSVGTQSATSKAGSTVKFKSADDAIVSTDNPLVKPNAGVYRSYEKWLRCYISDLGDSASVSNIEVFTTGTPNTGISVWAATFDTYCDANGDAEADPHAPRIGGYSSANALPQPKTNLFLATSTDPISLGAGPFSENQADGDIVEAGVGSYLALQMEVLPSATTGSTRSYQVIVRYDEE
jgi:hypothetical protein